MNAIARYLEELVTTAGRGWNRFWFTPIDPAGICWLRILVGMMACWFLLSFATDLVVWFGPHGLLPIEMARELAEPAAGSWNGRASYLFLSDDPQWLMAVHLAGILIAVSFTAGFLTRISSVLTLLVVLAYVHRGPLLMGPFEPVLTLMLAYLCLAPCGRYFSVDAWLRRRKEIHSATVLPAGEFSVAANVSQRLMQVHLAALYLMMGLTKLAGEDWWSGEAIWWLIAHPESRLIDLTWLAPYGDLINFWTHSVVVMELLFAVLIWNRLARPLLLVWSAWHWVMLGLITGLLSFSAMMLIANSCFLSAEWIRGRFLIPRTRPSVPSAVAARG